MKPKLISLKNSVKLKKPLAGLIKRERDITNIRNDTGAITTGPTALNRIMLEYYYFYMSKFGSPVK